MRLPLLPLLREVRRMPARRGEAHIALAAAAAARQQVFFAVGVHVAQHFARLRVAHQRAEGHGDGDVCAALAEAVIGAAPLAVARLERPAVAEVDEVAFIFVADDVHVAALAAVAAVRAAVGKALEALERVHAVAAVARLDGDLYFIRKQGCHSVLLCPRASGALPRACMFSAHFRVRSLFFFFGKIIARFKNIPARLSVRLLFVFLFRKNHCTLAHFPCAFPNALRPIFLLFPKNDRTLPPADRRRNPADEHGTPCARARSANGAPSTSLVGE